MSLIGLVRGAVSGKNTWSDVGSKLKALLMDDVVDPLEAFGEQFLSDFGKAAMQEAGAEIQILGPQVLAAPEKIGSLIANAIPVLLDRIYQRGVVIAENDAIQEAGTVVGNALRVHLTAAQVIQTTGGPLVVNHDNASAAAAAVVGTAVQAAEVQEDPAPDNVSGVTLTPHD